MLNFLIFTIVGYALSQADMENNIPSTAAMSSTPTDNPTKCPQNQHWDKCGQSCEHKCGIPPSQPCRRTCNLPACRCNENLFRNNDGQCVTRQKCDVTSNVMYNLDGLRPDNSRVEGQSSTSWTTSFTTPNDYDTLNNNNKCPPNEYLDKCGRWCENKCGTTPSIPCYKLCNPPACRCKSGLFRNHRDQCVPKEQCTQMSPNVRNRNQPMSSSMRSVESSSSEQADGHQLDTMRKINPPTAARLYNIRNPMCRENEFLNACGNLCERTCKNYLNPHFICVKICAMPACQCKNGFVRNQQGQCVKSNQCSSQGKKPDTGCSDTEIINPCGNACELTCEHVIQGETPICPLVCTAPQCQCKPGYARYSENKQCVPQQSCSTQK